MFLAVFLFSSFSQEIINDPFANVQGEELSPEMQKQVEGEGAVILAICAIVGGITSGGLEALDQYLRFEKIVSPGKVILFTAIGAGAGCAGVSKTAYTTLKILSSGRIARHTKLAIDSVKIVKAAVKGIVVGSINKVGDKAFEKDFERVKDLD